jgi:hypothetical protein
MKKVLLLITVFLIAGMTAWSQVKVTFNVDMSVWAKNGYFKPATDTVRVSGDFDGNGWSTTATTLTPGTGADSLKYNVQVSGVSAGVAHYKFIYINSAGVQWEDPFPNTTSTNRESTIGTSDTSLPIVFFKDITGKLNHVKFQVDMSVPIKAGKVIIGTTNVYVGGDMTDWQNRADLMTKGASDSVYSFIEDSMSSGSTRNFKFIYSATTAGAGTWEDDPNRTYFVPENDSTVFFDFWNRQNPNVQTGTGKINFNLDMSVMIKSGIFHPEKDSVIISGGFNGWTTTDPTQVLTQNPINDSSYFISHTFTAEPFGIESYKYVVLKRNPVGIDTIWKDGYERPVAVGGNNRSALFQGQASRDTSDAYDGVHTDWFIPSGTNLNVQFTVDMTPAMDISQQAIPFDPAKDTLWWLSEEPAFARSQGWYRPSDGHMKALKMVHVSGNLYSGTLSVKDPGFNAFEYRYEWQKGSDATWVTEPDALGTTDVYRVRYAGQDVASHFPKNPWTMPMDTWTNKPVKTDQEKDPYTSLLTGIKTENLNPVSYSLSQNYPNPFNPSTTIKFTIQKPGLVTLKIFNLLGQEVATLVNEQMKPGSYSYNFNASRLSSGVYFYNINAGSFIQTKKMLLLK